MVLRDRRVVAPVLHVEQQAHRVEFVLDQEVEDLLNRSLVEALEHHLLALRAIPGRKSGSCGRLAARKKKRGAFRAPVDAFDVELAAVCMQLTIPERVKVEWLTGGEDDSPRLIIRAA